MKYFKKYWPVIAVLCILCALVYAEVTSQGCTGCTDGQLNLLKGDNYTDGSMTIGKGVIEVPTAVSFTASYTITTPQKDNYQFSCGTGGGCTLWFSDTGATDGQELNIVNTSTNTITASEVTGKLEGTATLGQYDTMTVRYVSDRYVVYATSNN